MSEHHEHGRRASLLAAGIGGGVSLLEAVTGATGGSNALLADMVHNGADAGGYVLNSKVRPRQQQVRRWAARLICVAALITIDHGVREIDQPIHDNGAAVAVAGLAWLGSKKAHDLLHHFGGEDSGLGDNERHARWDKYSAPLTLAATVLSYEGVGWADQVGAIGVGAIVLAANFPTQARIGQNS